MINFFKVQTIIICLLFGQLLTPNLAFAGGEKISTETTMSQITLFGIALMAPIMYLKCFNTMSTKIFVAASVLYIANEIMNNTEYTKYKEQKVAATAGATGDNKQITTLELAAAEARKAKQIADKKAKYAKYITYGFDLATVAALAEWYYLYFGTTGLTTAYKIPFPPVTGMAVAAAGALIAKKSAAAGLMVMAGGAAYQCSQNKAEKVAIDKAMTGAFEAQCISCAAPCYIIDQTLVGFACSAINTALANLLLIPTSTAESSAHGELVTAQTSLNVEIAACESTANALVAAAAATGGVALTPPVSTAVASIDVSCPNLTSTATASLIPHGSLAQTILSTKCMVGVNMCDREKIKNTKEYISYMDRYKNLKNDHFRDELNNGANTFLASFEDMKKNDPIIIKALKIFNQLSNPSAKAKMGKNTLMELGLGGGIAALVITQTKFGDTLASFATEPNMRALLFGGFAVMAGAATDEIKKQADKLQEQANKYSQIAQKTKDTLGTGTTLTRTTTTSSGGAGSSAGGTFSGIGAVNTMDSNGVCASGSSSTLVLDKSCGCKATKTCKAIDLPQGKFMSFPNGTMLARQAAFMKDFANGMYSGNVAAATAAGDKASALAFKVNKLKKKLLGKLNESKKKVGLKPMNFDKLTKSMAGNISGRLNKAFNNLSPSQKASVLAIAPALVKKGTSKKKKTAYTKRKHNFYKGGLKSPGVSNFNFGVDKEKTDPIDVADNSKDNKEYNLSGTDISQDSGKNIFNIISSRYLKTAFDKLFDRKK